jgi:hypothetical protein
MKTHTHTQGPWHPVTLGASPDHAWAIDSELVEIARLPEWPDNQAEAEANARLIAAAPEMLAALESMLKWSGSDDSIVGPEIAVRNYARAAIAKAKGGEP